MDVTLWTSEQVASLHTLLILVLQLISASDDISLECDKSDDVIGSEGFRRRLCDDVIGGAIEHDDELCDVIGIERSDDDDVTGTVVVRKKRLAVFK